MDYEKMYNEALKRAKKFEEKYGGGYAEYIFPELAESEDERIRIELKEAFEAYDIESKWNGIPIRSIFAWLEKQKERVPENEETGTRKEQKPAWSEEDEKMMDSILNELGQHYKACTSRDCPSVSFSFKAYQKEIDWLKSLRPSWKPSEEQMNKLKEVIYGLCTCGNGPVLKSLYEDLKKLI